MQALINAGGKGSRMGASGVEKPLQLLYGKPSIQWVIEAIRDAKGIDDILVSVSDNTQRTGMYVRSLGVRTVYTSGESFMDDLHQAFSEMDDDFILTCPSDVPLLSGAELDRFINSFDKDRMESLIALVSCDTVRSLGVEPSFSMEHDGKEWAVSGISIMDRKKTLDGKYLDDEYYYTNCLEFAINVNTLSDLGKARDVFNRP